MRGRKRTTPIVLTGAVLATNALAACFGSVDTEGNNAPVNGAGGTGGSSAMADSSTTPDGAGKPKDGSTDETVDGANAGAPDAGFDGAGGLDAVDGSGASSGGAAVFDAAGLVDGTGSPDGSAMMDATAAADGASADGAFTSDSAAVGDAGAGDGSARIPYWSRGYGGPTSLTTPMGVKVDSDDNILLLANVSEVDFGDGALTGLALVKLDPIGNPIWSTAFPSVNWGTRVLDVDPAGNAVVCGRRGGDYNNPDAVYVKKFDPNGVLIWDKAFAVSLYQTLLSACAADSAGNVYVGGRLYGSIDFGGGALNAPDSNGDLVIAKLAAADGSEIWSKIGNVPSGGGIVESISVDGADNVFFTGWSAGAFDFGGGPVPIAGGDNDAFVAKLTPDGDVTYAKMFGGPTMQECFGAADRAGSDIALTGLIYGSVIDFGNGAIQGNSYYARFDAANNPMFARPFVIIGSGGPYPGDLVTRGSDVYAAGFFQGTMNFGLGNVTATGDDVYVIRLGPTGTTLEARTFPRTGTSGWVYMADAPNGDLVISGSFRDPMDFGTGVITSVGQADIFVARIPP